MRWDRDFTYEDGQWIGGDIGGGSGDGSLGGVRDNVGVEASRDGVGRNFD
jgi:hypothetical protein